MFWSRGQVGLEAAKRSSARVGNTSRHSCARVRFCPIADTTAKSIEVHTSGLWETVTEKGFNDKVLLRCHD